VWAEAIVSAVGLYVFVVQTLSARQPFFDRALLLDLNFITSNAFGLVTAIILFSAMALMPPMMQGLLGYSVFGAGLAMMPRGIGSFAAMLVVGRLVGRVNTRLLLIIGLCITSFGQFQMSHFDLSMDISPFISSGLCQGFGMGLMFVPLSVLAFATLDTRLRPEATAVYTMTRTLGSSVGISIMQAIFTNRASVAHADLAGAVQPASPALAAGLPSAMNPATAGGLLRLNGEISRQAAMVGYVDVFHLMLILTLMVLPTVFLMRTPRAGRHMTEVVVD
jgi:DHA2 family multidrug resistance protein